MIKIVPAERSHAPGLAANVRDLEKNLAAQLGQPVEAIINWHLDRSVVAYSAFVPDADYPAGMWGAEMETPLSRANVWVIATPLLYKYKYSFLIESKRFRDEMLDRFGSIGAFSYFSESCRWLEWLGMQRVKTHDLGGVQVHQYIL